MTPRIREILANGAMTLTDIAEALGTSRSSVHPYVHQMTHRTGELVKLPTDPPMWKLRSQHTELAMSEPTLEQAWRGAHR